LRDVLDRREDVVGMARLGRLAEEAEPPAYRVEVGDQRAEHSQHQIAETAVVVVKLDSGVWSRSLELHQDAVDGVQLVMSQVGSVRSSVFLEAMHGGENHLEHDQRGE